MEVEFIEQSHEILHVFGGVDTIAEAARTCYMSVAKDDAANEKLVCSLIKRGHSAMLEFSWMVVRVTCDRSIAQEITRHRLFSFAMESQRYVNYGGKGMRFILPDDTNEYIPYLMKRVCQYSASEYQSSIWLDIKPEIARYVLPNATATTLVMAANVTEWRHFFMLRCDRHAHPMMRKLACGILEDAKKRMPVVFDDIEANE